jgi:membrane-associated protein
MQYRRFILYNIIGGTCWTLGLVMAGYYFGTLTIVQENMSYLIIGVMLLTGGALLFIFYNIVRGWLVQRSKKT